MYIVSKDFHGNELIFESGRIAKQASGAVIVRQGECAVLVTATMGDERDGDFLPLTIDYVEKTYAAGKIPGGFFKREGKLSEKETLTSRLIDRPCRPLFPEGFRREVQVVATVMSADGENDTDMLAMCGASAALTISDIPFEGPIAAVRVGRVKGKLVVNPGTEQLQNSDLNMIVASTADAIVMVEGGAQQVPESEVLEALLFAQQEAQTIIAMQNELREKCGKNKIEFEPKEIDQSLASKIGDYLTPRIKEAVTVKEKLARREAVKAAKAAAQDEFVKEDEDRAAEVAALVEHVFEERHYEIVRGLVFDTKARIDGRDTKTVRPIDIDVGLLPRAHGSALFTRGETQAIVVATLGTEEEAQRLDNLSGADLKTFLLHYNFPPYAVGETKPMRGPGRREIGHGALAERALRPVLPDSSKFPYVIRIVSEITESNGSSSMASVCGGTLAMMDAGVPISAPVAGVAMGLMMEGEKYAILTDILGDEDHLGDMDFKVCGTKAGITALQMDIKIKGLAREIMEEALEQAREARLHILECMAGSLAEPRTELNRYAPRIVSFKISTEKIKDVIGPGGKTIRSITDSCDVKLDIQDDGTVNVASYSDENTKRAIEMIKSLTAEAEVGKLYHGVVKRIADFGAFVEILPGTDGLLHISQISEERIRKVTDVFTEGDEVWVKVLEVDRQGKIRLSHKDAVAEMEQQGAN